MPTATFTLSWKTWYFHLSTPYDRTRNWFCYIEDFDSNVAWLRECGYTIVIEYFPR